MKAKLYIVIIGIIFFTSNLSAQFKETEVASKVLSIDMYFESATVERKFHINAKQGKYLIKIKGVSIYTDPSLIKLSNLQGLEVYNINFEREKPEIIESNKKLKGLEKKRMLITDSLNLVNVESEIISKQEVFIYGVSKFMGEGNSVDQIDDFSKFYSAKLSEIYNKKERLKRLQQGLEKKKENIEAEYFKLKSDLLKSSGIIVIEAEVEREINQDITIKYPVKRAGWIPFYDLKLDDSENIVLNYKASIYQQTGENWENVPFSLNARKAYENIELPKLEKWNLDFGRPYQLNSSNHQGFISGRVISEDGEELPGVNVVIKGTSIGTVTNLNGEFSLQEVPKEATELQVSFIGMKSQEVPIKSSYIDIILENDVQQLQEVVVSGYGKTNKLLSGKANGVNIRLRGASSIGDDFSTTEEQPEDERILVRPENIVYQLDKNYSLTTEHPTLKLTIKAETNKADIIFYAIPKIDQYAYTLVRLDESFAKKIIPGNINVYSSGNYIGRSSFFFNSELQKVEVYCGSNKNIVVERESTEIFQNKKFLSNTVTDSRSFDISVRNLNDKAVELTVIDQIPVSTRENIKVTAEYKGAHLNEKSGILTWELKLKPSERITRKLLYEVEYPKSGRIYLE